MSKRTLSERAWCAAATVAAAAVLGACSGTTHHATAASSTPTATSSSASPSSSAVAPLLPGASLSTSAQPWSKAYAAQQFTALVDAFSTASGGSSITSSSSFADYIQYSQQIATACDPFLNGLREGQWPVNAQLTIVQFTRLQQTVCDVELARGQSGTPAQYQAVPPAPAGSDQQLLDLRLKIYSLLGI